MLGYGALGGGGVALFYLAPGLRLTHALPRPRHRATVRTTQHVTGT